MGDDTVRLFFPSASSPSFVADKLFIQEKPTTTTKPSFATTVKKSKKETSSAAAPAPQKQQLNEHECFAQSLSEFFLDFEKHKKTAGGKKIVDLLLTKHETYLQVLLSSTHNESYQRERDMWILLNLLRQPAEQLSATTPKLKMFDMTDAERLEYEFLLSPQVQLLHRIIRWTHLTPKPPPLPVESKEEEEQDQLQQVFYQMQCGALYFVPRVEVESTKASASIGNTALPKWRMESIAGGRPFTVKNHTMRTGNCFRARWKLACRDLAQCEDALPVERDIYGVLGGLPIVQHSSIDVSLWSTLRSEMETWSDLVLQQHHGECGELIRGRSRGEATAVEDALLVQQNQHLRAASEIFRQVLDSVDCTSNVAKQFLELECSILAGKLEDFVSSQDNASADFLRVLVHVTLYFYLNAQAKQLLPRVPPVSALVRERLISRYIATAALSPKQMLPYLFCIKTMPKLRFDAYLAAFSQLTLQSDAERIDFLQSLLPIANTFQEAELVVDILAQLTLKPDGKMTHTMVLETFRWLVLLVELQPEAQIIHEALVYCANDLLAKHLDSTVTSSNNNALAWELIAMMQNLGISNDELVSWVEIYTAWRAFGELTEHLAASEQRFEKAELLLTRTRDHERKRLFKSREQEVEQDEDLLMRALMQAMQSLDNILSRAERKFQQPSGLSQRNITVGLLVDQGFQLVDRCAQHMELLWKSVQRSGDRRALYGDYVLGMTRSLANETSKRIEQGGDSVQQFKEQVRSALQVIERSTKALLKEVELPLNHFL